LSICCGCATCCGTRVVEHQANASHGLTINN
jgi:hypothetical protein